MAVQVSRQFYGSDVLPLPVAPVMMMAVPSGRAYVSAMVLCNDTGYLDDDFCGFFHGGIGMYS